MPDVWLFSYGTLRDPDVQIALFGRVPDGMPDAITGFRLRMIEVSDPDVIAKSGTCRHPKVEPSDDPSDYVEGAVFRLTEREIAGADAYEVDYTRREIRLRSGLAAYLYR